MSGFVKLSSSMPDGNELNGLDDWSTRLVEKPQEVVIAVVGLSCSQITTDVATGWKKPTVRVEWIEVLGADVDVPQFVRDTAVSAREKRTGKSPLPFPGYSVRIVTGDHDDDDDDVEGGDEL